MQLQRRDLGFVRSPSQGHVRSLALPGTAWHCLALPGTAWHCLALGVQRRGLACTPRSRAESS